MQLDSMKPAPGSRKPKKRVGRGPGSGLGKTSGSGHKGELARAGQKLMPGFEGGQMPLQRRLPKRGFKNFKRVAYQVVNVSALAGFDAGSTVDADALVKRGLVRKTSPVKILASGKLDRGLTVKAHAFSQAARAAIEAAGGTAEVVPYDAARKESDS